MAWGRQDVRGSDEKEIPPVTLVEKGSELSLPARSPLTGFHSYSPPAMSPFPPALASPSLFCSPNPLPSSTASLISMAIKGEVWWAVPCILSRSIIAPFSGDTGAACGTNLPLPISSQRPGKPLPQPSRPSDPELVSGAPPTLRGLQLGLSHGTLHTGGVTPADLPRGRGQAPSEVSNVIGRELRRGMWGV